MKSFLLKKLLFSLFVISAFPVVGQQWEAAKIVNTSADTLAGYISWEAGKTMLFKSKEGAVKKFTNRDVNMVYVGGNMYASSYFLKLVNSNGNPVADSAFLKILISGDINLYVNENTGIPESPLTFIFQRKNSSALELIQRTTTLRKDGSEYLSVQKFYRNQLQNEIKDCPEMDLTKIDFYTEKSMIKVVSKYMACKGIVTNYTKQGKPKVTEISFLGGFDYSNVKFDMDYSTSQIYTNIPPGYHSSSKPFLGFQAAFPIGKRDKTRFITEAIYKATDLALTSNGASTSISIKYIRFNLGLRYSIPLHKQLSLDLTGSISLSPLVSKNYQSSISRDYAFRTTEIGYVYGVGFRWNRVSLFVRSENALFGAFTRGAALSTSANYLYMGTAVRIK